MYQVYKIEEWAHYTVLNPANDTVRIVDITGTVSDASIARVQVRHFAPRKIFNSDLRLIPENLIDTFPNLEETRAFLTMLTIMEE